MRAEMISKRLRRLHFYSVPQAGRMLGLGRTQSYAATPFMPIERVGRLMLVQRGALGPQGQAPPPGGARRKIDA